MSCVPLLKAWLWVSALASLAGWILSACGMLNRAGYVIFGMLALAVWWVSSRSDTGVSAAHRFSPARRLLRRFSHLLPACFLVLATLALLGGLLYAPTNHAGLTYRVARVLQWLSGDHWFWIHTPNYRMNNRACGIEWLTAPLLLFTRSDRALFLVNFIPFLLLPGLIFSVFRRLGVRSRVSWSWMWVLPTGYSFILQAGSLANDTFPTVYALAAVDFALRAYRSKKVSDLYYSIIAAALLTGAKASNLPLLLSWALALVLLWRLLAAKPVRSIVVVLAASAVSFLPTAILNIKHCGDWTGLSLERAGMEMKQPLVGLWGNSFLLTLNNLVPPFFPQAGWWNQHALDILPAGLVNPLKANFEAGFHMLWEMPTEDWVGLGFGVTALLMISIFAAVFDLRAAHAEPRCPGAMAAPAGSLPPWLRWGMLISPWIALLVYCVKSGMVTPARLISPYYPLLLPLLLVGCAQERVARARWWQLCSAVVCILAIPVIILTPARPLWPAQTILARLMQWKPERRLVARALKVYAVYRDRSDPLANVRAMLPPEIQVVGFLADGDDMDLSLWRPFFTRRVQHVLLRDSAADIRKLGVKYIIVGGAFLAAEKVGLEDWMSRAGAELVSSTTAILKVNEGPQGWHLVKLKESI